MDAFSLRNAWVCGDETAEFFDVLVHDDRDSYYIVARSDASGWHQVAVKAPSLGLSAYDGSFGDCYVTHNGFNGKRRDANRCRQVNAMMFDIDCHGGDHVAVLPVLLGLLDRCFSDGTLPLPNLFVETGRGVQIYYVLAKSTPYRIRGGGLNEAGIAFFRDVEKGLSDAIEAQVGTVPGANLDTCVYDFSRVGRVPGTFNAKAGAFCSLRSSSKDYYSLQELKSYCPPKRGAGIGVVSRRRKPVRHGTLLESRIRMLERLQSHRRNDCRGSREVMCFVFYNTATQLHGPDRAYGMTLEFNRAFSSPLPESDIAQIRRSVDAATVLFGPCKGDRGYYPLKASTIAEKLSMTPDEIAMAGLFATSRDIERAKSRQRTRSKREARDARICALYARGYSQREVAEKAGCSPRTVFSVVKREGVSRGNLFESVKAQFREVLDEKQGELAKNRHTSWVVHGCSGYGASPGSYGSVGEGREAWVGEKTPDGASHGDACSGGSG